MQKNSETNDTSFESSNKDLLESGKIGLGIILRVAMPPQVKKYYLHMNFSGASHDQDSSNLTFFQTTGYRAFFWGI